MGLADRFPFCALLLAILSLSALILDVVDGAFGYVAYEFKKDPLTISKTPIDELNKEELLTCIKDESFKGRIWQTG
jgi:phosphate transport system permease protein